MIGIEFPGGPYLEKIAQQGNPEKFNLPKPILRKGGCNMSFAGLKTAVLNVSKKIKNEKDKKDLAASFQKTIQDILCVKTKYAFREFRNISRKNQNTFVIAGGVAANKSIRKTLTDISFEEKFNPIFPPLEFCGDNAAMIAIAGLEKFKLKKFDNLDHPAKPRWPLDEKAAFLKGAGVKL